MGKGIRKPAATPDIAQVSFAKTSSDSFISTEIRQSIHRPKTPGLVEVERPASLDCWPCAVTPELRLRTGSGSTSSLLDELFRTPGYRCLVASSGREELEAFRRSRPPLIVTDVNLPLISGGQRVARGHHAIGLVDERRSPGYRQRVLDRAWRVCREMEPS